MVPRQKLGLVKSQLRTSHQCEVNSVLPLQLRGQHLLSWVWLTPPATEIWKISEQFPLHCLWGEVSTLGVSNFILQMSETELPVERKHCFGWTQQPPLGIHGRNCKLGRLECCISFY